MPAADFTLSTKSSLMNTRFYTVILCITLTILFAGTSFTMAQSETAWPTITNQCKPWAYWWWMGSAVDDENLTKQLETYQAAEMGGMHIIPIYGAKGYEDRYIDYLSPAWMERLSHTISEARRLGMDIDMTTGTGWCFGGPNVSDQDADAKVVHKTYDLSGGQKLTEKFDPANTQALVAYGDGKRVTEITDRIAEDGSVDWTAPSGTWKVYLVTQQPSGRKVKRAAPGGGGYMLNPFSGTAMTNYLKRFDEVFANYTGPMPRAMYHDSYEYATQWSPELFAEFEKRRGYRLQEHLPALFGEGSPKVVARVKADYRQTIFEVMTDDYIGQWTAWSGAKGMKTRNQAHGSPGNLLDLYAVADIPETEMFNKDRDPLVSKFASSAAHVTGKPLVSSETGTWLKDHFNVTLADMKYLLDDLFTSGVNHVIYHGTAYSPEDAGWPGWLFYASTEMNPRNAIWRDVPALNTYIARTQSILQANQPGNDILLYWPISDQWNDVNGLAQGMTVHHREWLYHYPIGKTAKMLWDRGYTFDYLSDRQLTDAKNDKDEINVPGGNYRVIVVPPCNLTPEATLRKLLYLASQGATVIFQEKLPSDVPGYGNLAERRDQFKALLSEVTPKEVDGKPFQEAKIGRGRLFIGDLEPALAEVDVKRETLVDNEGVEFIRRKRNQTQHGGYDYFIANRGDSPLQKWLSLATPVQSALLMDPMTGKTGIAAIRQNADGQTEVLLDLERGASMIVRTFADATIDAPAWSYFSPAGDPVEIVGTWQVDFIDGAPKLPGSFTTKNLDSWTKLGDDEAKRFAGTARYRITFDAPSDHAGPWMLDLGKVAQSARVTLNGQPLGTLITPPFRIPLQNLKATENVLEIEVTNLSMNRLRDLDLRGVKWKNFHDINFVNIDYRPFDASKWPLQESGLLGPVRLEPTLTKSK